MQVSRDLETAVKRIERSSSPQEYSVLKSLHVVIYPQPTGIQPGPQVEIDGSVLQTHQMPAPASNTFESSFDEFAERLRGLGAYVEPDGALIWHPPQQKGVAHLGGMMYETDSRLAYVEIEGDVATTAWREILSTLSGNEETMVIYLLPAGVFTTVDDFLAWHQGR